MRTETARGFSLIELLIVIVVIGIIAYVAGTAITSGTNAFLATDRQKEALDQSRIALERMTREIRNVASRAAISTANATAFCFVNTDGVRVSFRFPGPQPNTVVREEPAACPGASGNVLAAGVAAFSLSYLQADGSADPAPPSNTKRIRIMLTTSVSGQSISLSSEVYPRNL